MRSIKHKSVKKNNIINLQIQLKNYTSIIAVRLLRSRRFIVSQFYKHLTSGRSVAEALALGKRDMMNTYGDLAVPYYWAGFTLEGVGDNLISIKSTNRER